MAKSKREQIVEAVVSAIAAALPLADVERDGDTADRVTTFGRVVVRDGEIGSPEITLGRGAYFYDMRIHAEVYAQTNETRDAIMQAIEASVSADETFGGLAIVSDVLLAPDDSLQTQVSDGAAAIRAALLYVEVTFQSSTALT